MDRPANDIDSEARTVGEVYLIDPATKKPYAAGGGGGGGTSNTTEATQLEVLAAVEAVEAKLIAAPSNAANQTSALTKLDTLHTDLTTPATELPKTPLMATSDLSYAFDSSSASTERSLVASTASQTTKGYMIVATAAAATTLTFLDGTGGAVLFTLEFPAAGAFTLDVMSRPYFKATVATALFVKSSNAVKTTVGLYYVKGA